VLILEGKCPKCFGNLAIGEEDMSLTCEDCGYHEVTKDKTAFAVAIEEAEEWGPKERRLVPSEFGKLLLEPYGGLAEYLRETLKEAMKGLEVDESDLKLLRERSLINEGEKTEEIKNTRKEVS